MHAPQEQPGAVRPVGTTGWSPPEQETRPVFQPVEVRFEDGRWAVGRINAWWEAADGRLWCRLRVMGDGSSAHWQPYDPDRVTLLPSHGI
ncbi:hypothetical protein ACIRPK_09715 [Kitasatospora sp. NPDC101801]|uniref:hypothetical protein n=1 Tax=Kitasatospora sp. NPDC101801 TaxID=3364103 RepID=UPI00381F2D04